MSSNTCNVYFRKVVSVFFEYDTPRIVHIRSKKVGVISRFIQLCIIAYIGGFVMYYKKGYQEFGPVNSAVTSKLKGLTVTNFSNAQLQVPDQYKPLYRRVWDVVEYVTPPADNGGFFVTTNVIITPNQTMGLCDESPDVPGANCTEKNICKAGHVFPVGNGEATGKCIKSSQIPGEKVCEIKAWCPVENELTLPLNGTAVMEGSGDYTVFIKSSISFPLFGSKYRRNNILRNMTTEKLKTCRYSKDVRPYCPIFRLKDIVAEAGENYTEMALYGGVMLISIEWDCNLDLDFMTYCLPKYSFLRLDDTTSQTSKGYNFRHAYHHEFNRRTLIKAYGIKFVIDVQGKAGKFNALPTFLNIGAGLALLGVSTILCDIILLYCLRARKFYYQNKYLDVKGDDAYEVVREDYESIP